MAPITRVITADYIYTK